MPKVNPLGSSGKRVTAGFGHSTGVHTGRGHRGVDLGAATGTQVYATDSGKIIRAGWENPKNPKQGYGQYVVVKHPDGSTSRYGHLSKFCVEKGQTVQQGQEIGRVGSTGSSTGPHLHFETRNAKGTPVNPAPILANTEFDEACHGNCGESQTTNNHWAGSKSAATVVEGAKGETACNKIDTPKTIAVLQDTVAPDDAKKGVLDAIKKAKEYPDAPQKTQQIAEILTGGGTTSTPPSSKFLTSRFGSTDEIGSTVSSINNLLKFSGMDTANVRQFIRLIRSVPGVPDLNKLPYFKPLSRSIGSSITFLTDASDLKDNKWISNAASTLGQTTPISKLNRHRIFPPILEEIEKAQQDLNKSLDINLSQIHSQIGGVMSQFGPLLGFLPKEVTQVLGAITGVLGQAQGLLAQGEGFINQIMDTYNKLVSTAHGLDLIVDIAHLTRVKDQQSQMLSKLTDQFGDQLRLLQNIFPVKGYVQIANSVFESSIHGYPTLVNVMGDKIMKAKYSDDVLKAVKNIA